MGCSFSVNFSGILMNYILDRVRNNTNIEPVLLDKYVDDVLAVIKRNEIESKLKTLNNTHLE